MDFPFNNLETYGSEVKVIGQGTYGRVYLYKVDDDNKFIIKRQDINEGDITSATLREITYVKQLCCNENIIRFLDVVISDNYVDIVMLPAINDLHNMIRGLTPVQKKKIVYQICKGLLSIHSHNIMHRDLKPNNILIYQNNETELRAVIADFGLARDSICSSDNEFSREVYTLWYRAPEILLGGQYSFKADVWALGCIIAEIYLEKPLFTGDSSIDQLFRIFKILGTPNAKIWPDLDIYPEWDPMFPDFLPSWRKYKPLLPAEVYDLLSDIFVYDPHNRASIYDIIDNKFFDDLKNKDKFPISFSCEECLMKNEYYPKSSTIPVRERSITISWMIELSLGFNFSFSTISLAIFLLDSISQFKSIPKNLIQLYSISCVHIASQLNERYTSHLSDYVYMCNNAYNYSQISSNIKSVLKELNFNIHTSTSTDFCNVYGEFYNRRVRKLSILLSILTYFTPLIYNVRPSGIALACILLSCKFYNERFLHNPKIESLPIILEISNLIPIYIKQSVSVINWIELDKILYNETRLRLTDIYSMSNVNL